MDNKSFIYFSSTHLFLVVVFADLFLAKYLGEGGKK
jgi:hypothetical protein